MTCRLSFLGESEIGYVISDHVDSSCHQKNDKSDKGSLNVKQTVGMLMKLF